MSIFTGTFSKYVNDQLRLRESILSHGDTIKNRFGRHKTPSGHSLPAGAFYTNTIERQCTLRLCSGVDLDLRGNENVLEKDTFEFTKWKGVDLAKNWILEGGMNMKDRIADFKLPEGLETISPGSNKYNWDLENNPSGLSESGPRGGFTGRQALDKDGKVVEEILPDGTKNPLFNPRTKGTAYGDPWTRSDASSGYGIVPMPGITDTAIKTKSAYGSLREATVKFQCHNIRQLEILELLYMRPGFTLLLEWGWGPYIDNKGEKVKTFPLIPEFFKEEFPQSVLQDIIFEKIQNSSGNYDAMLGTCKNFEFKARADGGFDCSTTIISMGEMMEGLKGKKTYSGIKLNEGEDEQLLDNFQIFLEAIKQKLAGPETTKLTGLGACFTAGTIIETFDSKVPIEQIKIGDKVKTFNIETNKIETSTVTKTFTHSDVLNGLIINNKIKTTTNHPFYINKKWIEAKDLNIGDDLLHLDGSKHKITNIEPNTNKQTVYNFEVQGNHNYFAEGYLVHNKNA
tara:strand:+ start:6967 stop:8502 length:1536 start_codon:yes stop_codon:yes gene_type:complete